MDISSRLEYNRKIIELISRLIERHPELRFCQILWALEIIKRDENSNIIDNFDEESSETFKRIQNDYQIIAQEIALDLIYPDNIEPRDVYEKVLEQGLRADIENEIIKQDN